MLRPKRPLTAALLAAALLAPPAYAQSTSFETGELAALDAWSVGAAGPGALPTTLWRGSEASAIGALLDRLPASAPSPTAQRLMRRVALSAGTAPAGDPSGEFARRRFNALGRLGAAEGLARMGASLGGVGVDPGLAQFVAQAELAQGQPEAACRRAGLELGPEPQAFLLRLKAFCAALAQDAAGMELALEVARSAGAADAWLATALPQLAGAAAARPVAARYDNSLNVATSLAGQLRPGAAPLTGASNLALAALAVSDRAPAGIRAAAALRALGLGLIEADAARAALQPAFAAPGVTLPPVALSVRDAAAAGGGEAAAPVILAALRRAAAPGEFRTVAVLFAPDIARISPGFDAPAALTYARALLAAGDAAGAAQFLAAAKSAGLDAAALAPLDLAVAAASQSTPEAALAAVRARIDAAGRQPGRAARDAALMGALGAPLDGATRGFVAANPPQGGRAGDAGLVLALAEAAERGAAGETGLIAALLLADGAQGLDAPTLIACIRALRRVGLEDAARAAAVEALVFGAGG